MAVLDSESKVLAPSLLRVAADTVGNKTSGTFANSIVNKQ
jgi:hypothetical protein